MKEGELFKAGELKKEFHGVYYPLDDLFIRGSYKILEEAQKKKLSLLKRILKMIGYERV